MLLQAKLEGPSFSCTRSLANNYHRFLAACVAGEGEGHCDAHQCCGGRSEEVWAVLARPGAPGVWTIHCHSCWAAGVCRLCCENSAGHGESDTSSYSFSASILLPFPLLLTEGWQCEESDPVSFHRLARPWCPWVRWTHLGLPAPSKCPTHFLQGTTADSLQVECGIFLQGTASITIEESEP